MGTMTHVRIPDFSQPVPNHSLSERRAARAVALDLHPQALEPTRSGTLAHAFFVVGELLAAVAIIGGGIVLTALASLH